MSGRVVALHDTPLDLKGLDVDVPLPLDEPAHPVTLVDELGARVAGLRRALTEALDAYVDAAGGVAPPLSAPRFRALRAIAGTPVDAHQTPEERKVDGIARASAKWTDDEVATIDRTIRRLIAGDYYPVPPEGLEFTTADVWAVLPDGFPVTKGIAGRMTAARGAGIIRSTGRTIVVPASTKGPNHGQRLTVWAAT